MPEYYRLPAFVQAAMGGTTNRSPVGPKSIYLTFDDGPHPDSTPAILKLLNQANAKATFFCLGSQVELYPDVYKIIKEQGHSTGNHGYEHLDGFKISTRKFLTNVGKAGKMIDSQLFRPPYGHITPLQAKRLTSEFKIVFWDLLYADYKKDFNPEKAFNMSKKHITPGSILVLHDRPENFSKTKDLLTLVLEYLEEKSFTPAKLVDEKRTE